MHLKLIFPPKKGCIWTAHQTTVLNHGQNGSVSRYQTIGLTSCLNHSVVHFYDLTKIHTHILMWDDC